MRKGCRSGTRFCKKDLEATALFLRGTGWIRGSVICREIIWKVNRDFKGGLGGAWEVLPYVSCPVGCEVSCFRGM